MNASINVNFNHKARTIEITKKFDKAAARYGTEEYQILQNVRRDYPNYRIAVKTPARKNKDHFKGLTYKFMESYIKAHDEDGTIFAEFDALRGTSEEAREFNMDSASYQEIKTWFLDKYPAIAEFQAKRESILAKSAA